MLVYLARERGVYGSFPLSPRSKKGNLSLNFVQDQEDSSFSSKPCWVKKVLNSYPAFQLWAIFYRFFSRNSSSSRVASFWVVDYWPVFSEGQVAQGRSKVSLKLGLKLDLLQCMGRWVASVGDNCLKSSYILGKLFYEASFIVRVGKVL